MNIWLLLAEFFIRGLAKEVETLALDFGRAVLDVIRAFPNVGRMANVISRFATSLTGRAIAAPVTGIGEAFVERLRERRQHNRLIRADEAVRLFARGHIEMLQAITFTDETGIVGVLVGYAAGMLYRLVKRVKMLSGLIAAKSEAEFVAVIVSAIRRRALLYFWAALVVGVIGILIYLSALISFTCLCVPFIKSLETQFLLPQDSARVWRKRGGMSRSNARRGPDREARPFRGASIVSGETAPLAATD